MSKAKLFSSNEVMSGFLILFCTCLLLVLLFMSGKSQMFEETYDLHIRFHYISGLTENAPVNLAGYEIGKVTQIKFSDDGGPNVDVTITLKSNAVVRQGAEAFINVMGFMGETYIELTSGEHGTAPLSAGDAIVGTDPVPMMEIVKRGTELMEEFERSSAALQTILKTSDAMVNDMHGLLSNNEANINNIFGNLDITTENLKDMTNDLKTHPWKLLRKPEED